MADKEPTEREWLEGLRYEDRFPDNPGDMAAPGRDGALLTAREARAVWVCAWREPGVAWNPAFDLDSYQSGMAKLAAALEPEAAGDQTEPDRAESLPHREFEQSMQDLDEIADGGSGGTP